MACEFVLWANGSKKGDKTHIILHEYEKAEIPSKVINQENFPKEYKELFPPYLMENKYVHRPAGVVGIFPFRCEECKDVHTIIVAPKVVKEDERKNLKLKGLDSISEMAVYAINASRKDKPKWINEGNEIYACWLGKVYGLEKIMLFLTLLYLQKLSSLIRKDFRRYYLNVEDTLRCKIKGKIRIPKYLSNWVSGKRIDIPCRWNIFTHDNWDNRILKSVLETCKRWADPKSALYNHISGLASGELFYAFSEVSDVLSSEIDFSRTRLKPVSEYYRDSLSVAEQIINGVNSITSVSSSFKPVWIKTHELFEGFVNAIAKSVESMGYTTKFQKGKKIFCDGNIEEGPKAKPDVIIFKNGSPILVIDAKYKEILDSGVVEPEKIQESVMNEKILTQDMFQIFFYLSSTSCEKGIIVFPFWKANGNRVYSNNDKWHNFNVKNSSKRVKFIGLNLSQNIREVFKEAVSILKRELNSN